MNDETKEILIELIDYYNAIGTKDDPGFGPFATIVQRASKALERYANDTKLNSADVDPYAFDVVGAQDEIPDYIIKMEDEL